MTNPPSTNATIYGFANPLPPLDPETISPGVRDLVVTLREAGLFTTDSGDGSNYEAGMGCALPFHHVFICCPPGMESGVIRLAADLLRDRPGLIDWPATIDALDALASFAVVWIRHADMDAICERVGFVGHDHDHDHDHDDPSEQP